MRFLHGNDLNSAIGEVIRTAKDELLIVSPYIKLHERFREDFKILMDRPEVRVSLLFGKAAGDKTATFQKESIEFFKTLPNIEISHRKNLHAKFYYSDQRSVMCSMNLYAYSQDTNIEAGFEITLEDSKIQAQNQAEEAANYFDRIFEGADPMFDKRPQYESKLMGLRKTYTGSVVEFDNFKDLDSNVKTKRKVSRPKKVTIKKESVEKTEPTSNPGYCIVNGSSIPFNLERPLSKEGYHAWKKESNCDAKSAMQFCHFSGQKSDGKTSFSRPVLSQNWKKSTAV